MDLKVENPIQNTPKIVSIEMDTPPKVLSANDILNATGVSFGACVVAIAKIDENKYKAMHISPGSIVVECSSLIEDCLDSEITIYQSDISGEISEIYLNGNRFNEKSLKSALKVEILRM